VTSIPDNKTKLKELIKNHLFPLLESLLLAFPPPEIDRTGIGNYADNLHSVEFKDQTSIVPAFLPKKPTLNPESNQPLAPEEQAKLDELQGMLQTNEKMLTHEVKYRSLPPEFVSMVLVALHDHAISHLIWKDEVWLSNQVKGISGVRFDLSNAVISIKYLEKDGMVVEQEFRNEILETIDFVNSLFAGVEKESPPVVNEEVDQY